VRHLRTIAAAVVAAGLVLAPSAAAEGPRLAEIGKAKFPDRAFVLTLPSRAEVTPSTVRVRENGRRVANVSVTAGDQLGQRQFGSVLVIDASQSVHGTAVEGEMQAAREFAKRRNPKQPLAVIFFNKGTRVALPLTTDAAAIDRTLAKAPALAPKTHIYDATAAALQLLERGKVQAGTVIVLSDGADTNSTATQASVAKAARDSRARIYTVGLRTRAFSSTTLRSLADATGGVYAEAGSTEALAKIYRDLGAALSNQYILRYRSLEPLGTNVRVAARVAGQSGVATSGYSTEPIKGATAAELAAGDEPFADTTLGVLVISIVCALLLALAIFAVLAPRRSVRTRVERFVAAPAAGDEKAWTATLVERVFGDGDRSGTEGEGRWAQFSRELELARVSMSPEAVVFWTIIGTVVLGYLLANATDAVGASLIALALPLGLWLVVRSQVSRQGRLFDEQLPDNLQVIASAMRAGHTFLSALSIVLEDAPEPSRREFRRVLTDEQLGVPLQTALRGVAERMQSRDFERVALIVTLQRETGGNTAEVMDRLTETIRERMELRREIRTLTAQGRLTRWIVSALPPLVLIIVSLLNPTYMRPLFHTTVGVTALIIGVFMLITGSLIIKRIVEFEE
jgi:tight adherence protein B